MVDPEKQIDRSKCKIPTCLGCLNFVKCRDEATKKIIVEKPDPSDYVPKPDSMDMYNQ